MATNSVIEVRELTKRYGQTTVVDDVSFTVAQGEVFGIVGANGAGKTTTVECLQGLRRPDGGTMQILGRDPTSGGQALAGLVGSQLQESALPDRLRVEEALRLFATERAAPIRGVLETWGLTKHRRTAFANLSGGQKQRLFVALALLNRPEVVFLDELTQGLDAAARRVVWGLIRELRAWGTTVVLVTHFMDEAELLCDRLAVMSEGRIVGMGSPTELVARYGTPTQMSFTAPEGFDVSALQGLGGVDSIATFARRVVISGGPTLVAYVGAALVAGGDVPGDIHVVETSLEDALVPLLEGTPTLMPAGATR